MNNGLDCDVLVAEVRSTSHKPDEIYGLIERLSPGTRKVGGFGKSVIWSKPSDKITKLTVFRTVWTTTQCATKLVSFL